MSEEKLEEQKEKRMNKHKQILWDNSSIPTPSLRRREEKKVENTCEEVIAKNFPNLMRKTLIYIFKKLNKFHVKNIDFKPRHIIIKLWKEH